MYCSPSGPPSHCTTVIHSMAVHGHVSAVLGIGQSVPVSGRDDGHQRSREWQRIALPCGLQRSVEHHSGPPQQGPSWSEGEGEGEGEGGGGEGGEGGEGEGEGRGRGRGRGGEGRGRGGRRGGGRRGEGGGVIPY